MEEIAGISIQAAIKARKLPKKVAWAISSTFLAQVLGVSRLWFQSRLRNFFYGKLSGEKKRINF